MDSGSPLFDAVRACSIALLAGGVLHGPDVTAGNGSVIDWRSVKSGETVQADGDAFDTAYLFVALVGPEAALAAATRDRNIEPPPPAPEPEPRITAYMFTERGRARSFGVGPFTVLVQPHEDDAAHAAFTEALARLARGVVS